MRAGALALPAFLLLLAGPAATAAGPELPSSLGLRPPLCAGSFLIYPFDYGGDGITDLIIKGRGEMQGGVRLHGEGSPVHLVIRKPDGSWSRLQTHTFADNIYDGQIQDLDGDGLDDLVLRLQLGFHAPWALVFFRQEPGHGLVECGRDTVDSENHPEVYPLPRASLVRYRVESVVRFRMIRWSDAERKPQVVWDAAWPGRSDLTAIPTARGGMLISIPSRDSLRIDDFDETGFVGTRVARWGSEDYFDYYERVRTGSYDALWYSFPSSSDTIRVLSASADGESLASRSIAMPAGTHLSGLAMPAPGGAWICESRSVGPRDWSLQILRVDLEQARVTTDSLPSMGADPGALLWNGEGEAEILLEQDGLWSCVAPDLWQPAEPDLRVPLESIFGTGDVDGDGVLDCVVLARDEAEDAYIAILRGLRRPPWFTGPIPVGPYDSQAMEVHDIDGDGRNEIIAARELDQDQTVLDVQRWNGWRVEQVPGAQQMVNAPYYDWRFDDFDADGSAEVYFGNHCIRWDADCRPLPPLEITGEVPGYWFEITTDLDGDGIPEIVTSRSATIYATHIDLETGSYQRAGSWLAPFALDYAIAVNLDADCAMELCLLADEGHVLWDFPQGLKSPPVVVGGGPELFYAVNRSGDLDADGRADLYSLSSSFRMVFDLQGDRSRALYMSDVLLSENYLLSERFLDIDEDGDPDLLFLGQRGVYVRLNDRVAARSGGVPPLQVRFTSAHPARGFPRLAYRMSRPGPLEARLFDVTGRALWKMTQDVDTADWVELVVEPRSGGRTASGVYFLRVEGGGRAETRRIVFLP